MTDVETEQEAIIMQAIEETLLPRIERLREALSILYFAPHLIDEAMLEDEALLAAMDGLLPLLERYSRPAQSQMIASRIASGRWGRNSKIH